MKLTGKIVVKPFALGSKSAHDAVYLETTTGDYLIQREQDNPFESSDLKALSGKNVAAEGELDNYLFIAKNITEMD
ncbi:hypothetical protein DBR40_16915 [Pedobacter sp. KBW01]|uniref:hypothetical protein n=1 Tax=Pedobacter sp. KBW01 TaxID=2153364 RepID=UPI000F5B6590|nr:hypothetical protein [Pedobacter sp. KBW01]RQO71482.1 hypothetical protein DBR40_16915 [Pedobacter sp. KBW01]